jgi:hypothetical protein
MWMIDHTRAFRLDRKLRKPDQLLRIERCLFERLRALTPETLTAAVGTSLLEAEIDAVLARRTAIVTLFETRIARHGEAAVLYDLLR